MNFIQLKRQRYSSRHDSLLTLELMMIVYPKMVSIYSIPFYPTFPYKKGVTQRKFCCRV